MKIGTINYNDKSIRYIQKPEMNLPEISYIKTVSKPDIFQKAKQKSSGITPYLTISFCGYPVHIVDGGNHATNMQHFANAISNDMDIEMYNVKTNPQDANMKQLKSLEEQLKLLNSNHSKYTDNDYVAVPALASVPILNLQEQYNRIMHDNKTFTPENLKANKHSLLKFLKEIYENPNKYREYINYMDNKNQGIEYTYGVIREINKAKMRGAKVYIPSGHPHDTTLKWLADTRGLKPELYNYIATGIDKNGSIQNLTKELKEKNWYDFNLLSLSDANVVGVKGASNAQDYMFAAYDSCVTDGARGVYNFTPVRKDGKIIGYSYTDLTTNEYPYDEFPANDEVANIAKFVGLDINDVSANPKDIRILKRYLNEGLDTEPCPDKLYPINDIFSEEEIKTRKLNLQGDYVDKTLNLFFRVNNNNQVIFPKCDCEGSGKPGVLSMWGSCFAVFNAIARDINIQNQQCPFESDKELSLTDLQNHKKKINEILRQGTETENYKEAENIFNYAIDLNKAFEASNNIEVLDFKPYQLLGNLHFKHGSFDYAGSCYNNAINILAKKIFQSNSSGGEAISKYLQDYEDYRRALALNEQYNHESKIFWAKGLWGRLCSKMPEKPEHYDDYDKFRDGYSKYVNSIKPCADMYNKLAVVCSRRGEYYPAKVCKEAASDILKCNSRGEEVLRLRSEGVSYIGDLYNEIKKEDY